MYGNKPKIPRKLSEQHGADYCDGTWRQYSLKELGQWVHLLHKRAGHRSDPQKRAKDLEDARNYLSMMGAWLDAAGETS